MIFIPDIQRSVNEFDVRFLIQGIEGVCCEVEERASITGAEIIQPALRASFNEEEYHGGDIFDIDEIAKLFAVFKIGAMGAEEPHLSIIKNLVEGV